MAERVDWRNLPPVPEDERPELREGWQPSQSFLKLHDRCDRAAMLYLRYGGGAGSLEMNRGSAVHDVIATGTQLALDRGEGRLDSPEIAKDLLLEYLAENPAMQLSAVERDACRYMLHNWALGDYWDPTRVIAVETPLTWEVGGYRVMGRPDRAEAGAGTVDVIDFKTGFPPSAESWKKQAFGPDGQPRFAGDFQTVIYACLIAFGTFPDGMTLGEGFETFRLRLVFPRILRGGVLAEREAVITRAQLLDFKFDLEEQLRRLTDVNLGEGRWQPTPGSVCRECPAKYECPLPPVLRAESQVAGMKTVEDLETLLTSAHFMGTRSTELKKRVRAAAEAIDERDPGALDLGDGEKGIRIGGSGDEAYVFVPTRKESVRNKDQLVAAVEAAKLGEDFDYVKHWKVSEGVEFSKKKVGKPRG